MRMSTARDFRDTTGLLRSKTPILVTRRGRVAGIFFPRPELTLPIELKRELYLEGPRHQIALSRDGDPGGRDDRVPLTMSSPGCGRRSNRVLRIVRA